jgi:hypothetical protein
MKTRESNIRRECDFCKDENLPNTEHNVIIDGPTTMGPWANMCEHHWKRYGCNASVATRFEFNEKVVSFNNKGKVVRGKEDISMEYLEACVIGDWNREVECPLCGDCRQLEMDATYFNCECGAKVTCGALLC